MSVLVGVAPDKPGTGGLELGIAIARALHERLEVLTVSPAPWSVPSMARVDAEFSEWAAQRVSEARAAASDLASRTAPGLEVGFQQVESRSIASTLLEEADRLDASVLVIGSSADAKRGRVELGSTGDRLVHSSAHALAISPRGYAGPSGGFTRITCAVAGRAEDEETIRRAAELAERGGVPLRLVTFAVRRDTMYPPEVGLDAEDDIVGAVHDQADAAFGALRADGVIGADVETVVAVGRGWRGALDDLAWDDDEMLAIGSKPQGVLSRVFLGSSATKIVRYCPVPVIVLPA